MTETVEDIAFVKFYGVPEVVTPVANEATQGVWGRYEIVNMGTASTDAELSVSVVAPAPKRTRHDGAGVKVAGRDADVGQL